MKPDHLAMSDRAYQTYERWLRSFGYLPVGHPDLRFMPYPEFLKTRYWLELRNAIIEKFGERCQSCGAIGRVQLHHRTYAHRGLEYWFLEDLMLLCEPCHGQVSIVWQKDGIWNSSDSPPILPRAATPVKSCPNTEPLNSHKVYAKA